jgi:hypothetical protein
MIRVPHTVNGEFAGMYYLDAGSGVYLAHRRSRDVCRKTNAWLLDVAVLEKAKTAGAIAAGVVTGKGSSKKFWIALIDDFFSSPYSFARHEQTRQRGLPLAKFRVNPFSTIEYIEKTVKIR